VKRALTKLVTEGKAYQDGNRRGARYTPARATNGGEDA